MGSVAWSTVQLAEFLEVFGILEPAEIEGLAIDHVAEALDAEVAALIVGGVVVHSLGFPADRVPHETLVQLVHGRRCEAEVQTLGAVHALSAEVGQDQGHLLVLRRSSPFDREEEVLLRAMGRALSMAMAATRSRKEMQQLAEQLAERQELSTRMFRIQQSISHRAPLQEVLDSITHGAADLLRVEVVGLRVSALEDDDIAYTSLLGYSSAMRDNFARLPLDHGFAGRAFVEDGLVVTDRYRDEPQRTSRNVRHELEIAMAAPVHRNGQPVGVLTVASSAKGRTFTSAEQETLLGLAEHASLAVNDAAAIHNLRHTLERVTFEARHDGLTGLLNRSSAVETLDEELAGATDSAPVSVLFVDLDRFKPFNDMFGHAFGDQVLVAVAERLRSTVGPRDTVARLSGDEFLVVAPATGSDEATVLAERLTAAVTTPFRIDGREVELTVSIGVAAARSERSGQELLAGADMAMYRAKQGGRGGVVQFDQTMRSDMSRRIDLERELTTAVRSGDIRTHFQPLVDLDTGSIRGLEALARWEHSTLGLRMPADFIAVAEDIGLILEIDQFVLEDACRQLARWEAVRPDLTVSVNLSARHFTDFSVVDMVRSTLHASGIDGSKLWLEITESVVMGDTESTLDILQALRSLGVRFMVDDFGTGYSSLVYLKRLPVSAVKIDRGFVDGLGTDREDEAIVTAIMRLAEAIGLEVVAEGVETQTQVQWLRRLGCQQAQGYHYSRPLDIKAVDAIFFGRQRAAPTPTWQQTHSEPAAGRVSAR